MLRSYKYIGYLFMFSFIALCMNACVTAARSYATSETLVLASGAEIPCEILEVDEDYIYFEAAIAQDRYKYGESLPIGEVKFVKVFRNDDVIYLTLEEYLEQNTDFVLEEESGEETVSDEGGNEQIHSNLLQKEFRRITDSNAEQKIQKQSITSPEFEGPGLRLQRIASDSVLKKMRKSGIGLRLPDARQTSSTSKVSVQEYADVADLIVASGATGLILYRAEQLSRDGVKLSDAQKKVIARIGASEQWQKRREGLLAAHRVASEDFAATYNDVMEDIAEKLGYRPADDQGDIASFILYLHTHGGLQSSRTRRQMDTWFGEIATRAIADILANFSDWYYIAGIGAKESF
jgi:hypothetical protein